ncbi:MAG: hypothetical protein ACK5FT_08250 [Sphingomonadales bacterium]|jgi:hypothetical protein
MKIEASQLLNLKKIPCGYHCVKIVQIIDHKEDKKNNIQEHVDMVFHGSEGFIICSFFNTPDQVEQIIRLFRVCNIETPLNYHISTQLLWNRHLIIEVKSVTDLQGNPTNKVTDIFRIPPYSDEVSDEYDLPKDIEYTDYIDDIHTNTRIFERIYEIDNKYKYTRHLR